MQNGDHGDRVTSTIVKPDFLGQKVYQRRTVLLNQTSIGSEDGDLVNPGSKTEVQRATSLGACPLKVVPFVGPRGRSDHASA